MGLLVLWKENGSLGGGRTLMMALITVTMALTTAMKQLVMALTRELNLEARSAGQCSFEDIPITYA